MNTEEFIEKFKCLDNESKTLELKKSDKLNSMEDILKIICALANTEGGDLIFGINDNGTPEGISIFEKFAEGKKSGVDKVKEKINNSCLDNISPHINITITHHAFNDEYEFISVNIPKRKKIPHAIVKRSAEKINSRTYYAKNSHSVSLVSDTQLEWMFSNAGNEIEENYFNVSLTTFKNLGGIPLSFNSLKIASWEITQPQVINHSSSMRDMIRAINNLHESKKANGDEFERFYLSAVTEIVTYAIVQTIDGFGSRVIGPEAQKIPIPPENFLLSKISESEALDIFESFTNAIYTPPKTEISFNKENNFINCILENPSFKAKISVRLKLYSEGLPQSSLYKDAILECDGLFADERFNEDYEHYAFSVVTSIERKFPDNFDANHEKSMEFCDRLNSSIKDQWDIDNHILNRPHFKKIYAIDYKIDHLIKLIQLNSGISRG